MPAGWDIKVNNVLEIAVSRDKAIEALIAELEWLSSGISHPDTTAWLFIHYITSTGDASLLDIATEGIKAKVRSIVDAFKLHGHSHFYNSKGELIEKTDQLRALSELLSSRRSG